jgi:hypothetical protein
MKFEYACFISYRHGPEHSLRPIIDELYDDISGEIGLQLEHQIYLDKERMQGGANLDQSIAYALCKSACMLVFYTPLYFHKNAPYCAREFKAMQMLEERRMALVNDPREKIKTLIIPIVFRKPPQLPADINSRMYYDFQELHATRFKIRKRPRDYLAMVKKISDYIVDRCRLLESLPTDPCSGCHQFELPTVDEVAEWLGASDQVIQRLPTQSELV